MDKGGGGMKVKLYYQRESPGISTLRLKQILCVMKTFRTSSSATIQRTDSRERSLSGFEYTDRPKECPIFGLGKEADVSIW